VLAFSREDILVGFFAFFYKVRGASAELATQDLVSRDFGFWNAWLCGLLGGKECFKAGLESCDRFSERVKRRGDLDYLRGWRGLQSKWTCVKWWRRGLDRCRHRWS